MDSRFPTDREIIGRPQARPLILEQARKTLLAPESPGILVLGEPGCGKTFFLRALAASLARDQSAAPVFPLALDTASDAAAVLDNIADLLEESGGSVFGPFSPTKGPQSGQKEAAERWSRLVGDAGRPVVVFLDDLPGVLSGLSPSERIRLAEGLLVPGVTLAASVSWRTSLDKAAPGPWAGLAPVELSPLSPGEAGELWRGLCRETAPEIVGPCLAAALGNPRLLAALAAPLPGTAFPDRLAAAIASISDDFEALFETLPTAERRLFACLAHAWNPVTAREAGEAAAMDVNKASSLASRLAGRGLARVAWREGRRKWYEARHPGLSLARQAAHPAGRRRLTRLARFAAALYAPPPAGPAVAREDTAPPAAAPGPGRGGEPSYPLERDVAKSLLAGALEGLLASVSPGSGKGLPPLADLAASGLSVPEAGVNPVATEAALRRAVEENPDDPGAWCRLGAFLHAVKGAAMEAEEAYLAAVDRQSDQAWTWLGLARLLHEDPDRAVDAEQAYRIATSLAPDDPMVWALLGRLYGDLPDRDEDAEKALVRALALKPDFVPAREALARIYERTDREEEARRIGAGGQAGAWRSQGGASWMVEAANSPDSLKAREECVARAMDTGDPKAWALAGLLAARAGTNFREGAECLEQWAEADSGAIPWLLAASARLLAGERENAARLARQVLDQDPKNPDAWLLHGLFLGNGPTARAALSRSLSPRPDHPLSLAASALLLAREPGQEDEARTLAKMALEKMPDLPGAWAALGVLEARKGRVREAEEAFRRVVSENPEEAWPFVELGALLSGLAGRPGDAGKALNRAVALDPESARAWRLLGGLAQREGNPARAVEDLEKAAALDPGSPEIASGLTAVFLVDFDDPVNAARAVERFLAARPDAGEEFLESLSGLPGFARMVALLPSDASPGGQDVEAPGAASGAEGLLDEAARGGDPGPALAALLEMAASGNAREALERLRASPARAMFEPMEAALAVSLGEPPLWPPEILGLGREVAARFGKK